jgi:hypothetical protein
MMERCRRCSMPRRRCDGPTLCHCCGAYRPWKVYMDEQEWLTSTDIQAMLRVAQDHGISPRKLRLLACAVLRAAGIGTRVHDNICALRIAEDFADGLLTPDALRREYVIIRPAPLSEFVLRPDPLDAVRSVLEHDPLGDGGRETAPALLRDLVGNPFRRVVGAAFLCGDALNHPILPGDTPLGCSWCDALRTPTVLSIARTIYDERAFGDLPILADALEDAGCDRDALLDHLRSPGPHARGCWALDLILGKE